MSKNLAKIVQESGKAHLKMFAGEIQCSFHDLPTRYLVSEKQHLVHIRLEFQATRDFLTVALYRHVHQAIMSTSWC